MRPLQYVVGAALVVTGCGEPLRVALGARDITHERCTIRQGAGAVLATAGRGIDAVGVGRGRVSCPSKEGEHSREVEVVAPSSLRIEGPAVLPYRDRAVYTLRAKDEKDAPLAVGNVALDYGGNLTSRTATRMSASSTARRRSSACSSASTPRSSRLGQGREGEAG